jgi:hypothetical protein
VWGNIDAGEYDDPVNDFSEGGGTGPWDATEIDVWAEYGHPIGSSFTGTMGGLLYLFPNESGLTNEANQTFEVYGKLQATGVLLAPKVAAFLDVAKVNGLYLETSLSHTLKEIKGFPITFGALAGWSAGQAVNADDPAQIANFAENGLTHLDFSATGAVAAGPVVLRADGAPAHPQRRVHQVHQARGHQRRERLGRAHPHLVEAAHAGSGDPGVGSEAPRDIPRGLSSLSPRRPAHWQNRHRSGPIRQRAIAELAVGRCCPSSTPGAPRSARRHESLRVHAQRLEHEIPGDPHLASGCSLRPTQHSEIVLAPAEHRASQRQPAGVPEPRLNRPVAASARHQFRRARSPRAPTRWRRLPSSTPGRSESLRRPTASSSSTELSPVLIPEPARTCRQLNRRRSRRLGMLALRLSPCLAG